jgi:hypothetical protein
VHAVAIGYYGARQGSEAAEPISTTGRTSSTRPTSTLVARWPPAWPISDRPRGVGPAPWSRWLLFGGRISFNQAASGQGLAGVVGFYGRVAEQEPSSWMRSSLAGPSPGVPLTWRETTWRSSGPPLGAASIPILASRSWGDAHRNELLPVAGRLVRSLAVEDPEHRGRRRPNGSGATPGGAAGNWATWRPPARGEIATAAVPRGLPSPQADRCATSTTQAATRPTRFTQQRSRAGGMTSTDSLTPGPVDYRSSELQSASRLQSSR